MNEKTFERLLEDLKSDDYSKVEDAANTLCSLKDSTILSMIKGTLKTSDNPLIQRVLLLSLKNYENLDYQNYLPYLENENEDVKEAAQELFIAGKESAIPVLIRVISSSASEQLKSSVVFTLGQYHQKEVIVPLLSALNDSSVLVRIVAAYSLSSYEGEDVTCSLIEHLNDEDDEVKEEILYSLKGRELSVSQISEILPLLSHDSSHIRIAAINVLNVHVPDIMANDQDPKVRREVATVSVSASVLVKLCGDENASVRMASVETIHKNGLKMDELMISLTKDENPGVRRSAATALENSSGSTVINALEVVLHDSKPGVSAAAAKALGKIGGEEAKRVLEGFKDSGNAILAGIIKEALSQIK